MFDKLWDIIETVWNGAEKVFTVVLIAFATIFALGTAVAYPWTCVVIVPIIIAIVVAIATDRKKKKVNVSSASYPTYGGYAPRNLRAIADEKRIYMYQMYDQYDIKRKELESLEQRKDSINEAEYDREWNNLNTQVSERKQYYDQAVEEYRAAELEAP